MPYTDVLVIGSGIAGLSVAIKVAERFPLRKISLITKGEQGDSNTTYAQGGIAVVSDRLKDSPQLHIRDTLNAGAGLCNPEVVERVVAEAGERLQELINYGVPFDRNAEGKLELGREGGHTVNRIVHCGDATGLKLSQALLAKVKSLPNIAILEHHIAIDLMVDRQTANTPSVCAGAYVLNSNKGRIEKHAALVTVLATGGIGQIYKTTTNPLIATGDGIAMAHRAGAAISNMEFIQFHPTGFYSEDHNPVFLISEAVRGYGAYLRNASGERFMFRYHPDGELACRDIVSRAIAQEIHDSKNPFVYLDCTHLSGDALARQFPIIYNECLSRGINLQHDLIPVAPAAHYLCGGIDVDLFARTSIQHLYACGECSNTGLHGANRLASNSLLEAVVYAHRCFLAIQETIDKIQVQDDAYADKEVLVSEVYDDDFYVSLRTGLRQLMNQHAGIVRYNEGLEFAANRLAEMENMLMQHGAKQRPVLHYELRNMITCARLIINHSLQRKENRGTFYNADLLASQLKTLNPKL